jgi:hypothetical protein
MGCQLTRRRRQLGLIRPLHKLSSLADCYATLGDFMEKFDHFFLFRKFSVKFFNFFFGYHGFTSDLEYVIEKFGGGLGPLVWEEIENEQTVHKGLAKLLYRFVL